MTTNSSNTSSAGSHEKVTIQSSKLPETTQSNVQGQPAVEEKVLILNRFQRQQTVEARHYRKMRKRNIDHSTIDHECITFYSRYSL